jgi:hypothetical protein
MSDPFDYMRTSGMYNRFLAEEGSEDIMGHRELGLHKAITDPRAAEGRPGEQTAALIGKRSKIGEQYARDELLTKALFSGGEGRSEADSLKLVEALSPVGRKVYENFYSKGKSTTEDKIIDTFLQQDNKYKMGE